jgi:excisionase family DNA binding protein
MSPPTRENTPPLDAGSRYGPTPAPRVQEQQWTPTLDPGDHPHAQAPTSPTAPLDLTNSATSALATLPEVLTVSKAAAILRIGRNQLYQAVGRGELGAVRIGRSIRIPKHALLDLLTVTSPPAAGPPTAHGDE